MKGGGSQQTFTIGNTCGNRNGIDLALPCKGIEFPYSIGDPGIEQRSKASLSGKGTPRWCDPAIFGWFCAVAIVIYAIAIVVSDVWYHNVVWYHDS